MLTTTTTNKAFPHFDAWYSKQVVKERIAAIGKQANSHYRGKRLTTVTVLNGAAPFAVNFQQYLSEEIGVIPEYVKMSSYHGGESSRQLVARYDLLDYETITDQHVLILDDILDTGKTLHTLCKHLLRFNPKSLRIAVLLKKKGTMLPEYTVEPDYVGFEIENEFVIGYGMDYDNMYRNYRYIAKFDKQKHEEIKAWMKLQDADFPPIDLDD